VVLMWRCRKVLGGFIDRSASIAEQLSANNVFGVCRVVRSCPKIGWLVFFDLEFSL
jgi:hypothetical protein